MNKKVLLIIILIITCVAVGIILILNISTKYNNLIISEDNWNEIISNRNISNSIILENIKFNEYNLLIDEKDSIIYYSIIDLRKKYNPSVEYSVNNDELKIAVNKIMNSDEVDGYKIMIYNDNMYRIYSLVITNYSTLNIKYQDNKNNKSKISVSIELFDNRNVSSQKVLKSEGKLKIVKENSEYEISLLKESLGHNKRENHVSMFGMEKQNEYKLIEATSINTNENYVRLFINNKYVGIYKLEFKNEKSVKNGQNK